MALTELIWHNSQFAAHQTQGKSRIFAIDHVNQARLEVVTTLDGADAVHTDRLIDALDALVNERAEEPLAEVLAVFPQAVQLGVRDYAQRRRHAPKPGTYSEAYGRLSVLRVIYTTSRHDLYDLMSAAYLIGLGIRTTNERPLDGNMGWELNLLTAEPYFDSTDELRRWSESLGYPLLSTWISDNRPVEEGLDIALKASRDGHLVRLHSCELPGESKIVVDVYDAPIPVEREEVA